MLYLKHITACADKTDEEKSTEDINLRFRTQEFVAILNLTDCEIKNVIRFISMTTCCCKKNIFINNLSPSSLVDNELDALRHKYVGLVLKDTELIGYLNVCENVEIALALTKNNTDIKKQAIAALEKVGLIHLQNELIHKLTNEQKTTIAIARVLTSNQKIILIEGIEEESHALTIKLIKEQLEDKLVILFGADEEKIKKYADRCITIENLAIKEDTNPYLSNDCEKTTEFEKTSLPYSQAIKLTTKYLLTNKIWAAAVILLNIALISINITVSTNINITIILLINAVIFLTSSIKRHKEFELLSLLGARKKDITRLLMLKVYLITLITTPLVIPIILLLNDSPESRTIYKMLIILLILLVGITKILAIGVASKRFEKF